MTEGTPATIRKSTEVVLRMGAQLEPAPAPSPHRFPDGAHFRVEIPSVEGPEALAAVFESGDALGLLVNRVSQGSGAMLLSEAELREMATIGADRGIEVSLFVGPAMNGTSGLRPVPRTVPASPAGLEGHGSSVTPSKTSSGRLSRGFRSFLVADSGLLELLADSQRRGELPSETIWKVSALMAPTNPATFAQLERLGASTINVPSDMTLGQLAELRSVSDLPIDLYVESPDSTGGIVRGHEVGDLISVAAPMYSKFGLRNSRGLYPSGLHLRNDVIAIAREKVRRAAIALEWLARMNPDLVQSGPGAKGLGLPAPN